MNVTSVRPSPTTVSTPNSAQVLHDARHALKWASNEAGRMLETYDDWYYPNLYEQAKLALDLSLEGVQLLRSLPVRSPGVDFALRSAARGDEFMRRVLGPERPLDVDAMFEGAHDAYKFAEQSI